MMEGDGKKKIIPVNACTVTPFMVSYGSVAIHVESREVGGWLRVEGYDVQLPNPLSEAYLKRRGN